MSPSRTTNLTSPADPPESHTPPPHTRALGGVPQPNAVEYYRQRTSQGGLIISEATCVSAEAHGYPCTPTLYMPESLEGWKPVVKVTHGMRA